MNQQDNKRYEYTKLVAQTQFALIAPIVSGTYPDDTITAYFDRISRYDIEWPDGTKRKFSSQTIKGWLHLYRKFGLEGIIPKSRLDAGCVRKLNVERKEYIKKLIKEFPKITGVMIYEKMIEQGLLNHGDISVDTIQRYIRNFGIRNGKETITKEKRT